MAYSIVSQKYFTKKELAMLFSERRYELQSAGAPIFGIQPAA
jgi:hypothetical protein